MVIDFHTHTFPDKIAAAALTKMQGDSHTIAFTAGTVTALKQSMEAAGILCSVVLPVATNPAKVRSINDLSVQLTERDGLIYFGCIHPDLGNADQELKRIADAGLKGVKIHPVYQGVDIDDIRYLRILDRCGERGLTVVTHAGDDIGFPGVIRCSPKMILNALKQVGDVRLVAAHMGGWKNWDTVAELFAQSNVYIDTAFSLGTLTPLEKDHYSKEEQQLLTNEQFCKLVRGIGSKRILFGTDSPWTEQTVSKEQLLALPLSDAEKADILGENARRLLNIK